MEVMRIPKNILAFIDKNKYVILVIAVGAILMFLSRSESENKQTDIDVSTFETVSAEQKLEQILEKINGAGRVSVLLTTAQGEETCYQSDVDQSDSQCRNDTVILTDSQRAQSGLVVQVNPPIYLGAIIVCDGADDPVVRYAIVEAVSKATGLGVSSISVLKMN